MRITMLLIPIGTIIAIYLLYRVIKALCKELEEIADEISKKYFKKKN